MDLPKVGEPNKISRRTHSNMILSQDQVPEVEKPSVHAVFFNVDVIPSPKLVIPTLVKEHDPIPEKMDVDPRFEEKNLVEA
jgi:hypothetical protein